MARSEGTYKIQEMVITREQVSKFPKGSVQPGKSRSCDKCGKLIMILYHVNGGRDACSEQCRGILESKSKEDTKLKKDTKPTPKKKIKEEAEEPEEDDLDETTDEPEDEEEGEPEDEEEGDPEEEESEDESEEEDEEEAPKKSSKKPVKKVPAKKPAKAAKKSAKSDDDEDEAPAKKTAKKKGKKSAVRPIREGTQVRKMFLRLANKGKFVERDVLFNKVEKPYHKLFYLKQQALKHGWDWKEQGKPASAFKLTIPRSDYDVLLAKE